MTETREDLMAQVEDLEDKIHDLEIDNESLASDLEWLQYDVINLEAENDELRLKLEDVTDGLKNLLNDGETHIVRWDAAFRTFEIDGRLV